MTVKSTIDTTGMRAAGREAAKELAELGEQLRRLQVATAKQRLERAYLNMLRAPRRKRKAATREWINARIRVKRCELQAKYPNAEIRHVGRGLFAALEVVFARGIVHPSKEERRTILLGPATAAPPLPSWAHAAWDERNDLIERATWVGLKSLAGETNAELQRRVEERTADAPAHVRRKSLQNKRFQKIDTSHHFLVAMSGHRIYHQVIKWRRATEGSGMTNLEGIEKAVVIERVVKRNLTDKAWRSECEKGALGFLVPANKRVSGDLKRYQDEKARVLEYCKEQYAAAGANWQGRW